ncbi:hypothetical protein [Nocardia sp. NBC_01388]|uniref:hypothetical protein n=1 Tax=Nocardia sp. NBC_01388 TaxID=2903596 RepID=UPI0032496340
MLAKTVVFSARTDDPTQRVIDAVRAIDAEAVVIPGIDHFEGYLPPELLAVADVITVSPEQTFARWFIPPDAPADRSAR